MNAIGTIGRERPILFSAPMVRSILDGRKTQTRRVVKGLEPGARYHGLDRDGLHLFVKGCAYGKTACPHGVPGDRLWVREAWSHTGDGVWTIADARRNPCSGRVVYRATDDSLPAGSWWPSIHMPREFSRIALQITDVRVERLNDISQDDALAEGAAPSPDHPPCFEIPGTGILGATPADAFNLLWDNINGPESWDANPWVWAVTFQRVSA